MDKFFKLKFSKREVNNLSERFSGYSSSTNAFVTSLQGLIDNLLKIFFFVKYCFNDSQTPKCMEKVYVEWPLYFAQSCSKGIDAKPVRHIRNLSIRS